MNMEFKNEMIKMKNELSELINNKCDTINENINSFKTYVARELSKLKSTVEDIDGRVDDAEQVISSNLQKIEEQTYSLEQTKTMVLDKISNLEKDLASQIDRGMRSTLTFRGVIESQNESYQKTPKVLANLLSKMDSSKNKLSYSEILDSIDRAHRSRQSTNHDNHETSNNDNAQQTNQPRPIHVKFTTWKDSEYFKSVVITHNKKLLSKGKKPSVFVDNMYSDFTNNRRKKAWAERKSLRDSGLKAPMYVKYPATLMVKNNETGKYIEHSLF